MAQAMAAPRPRRQRESACNNAIIVQPLAGLREATSAALYRLDRPGAAPAWYVEGASRTRWTDDSRCSRPSSPWSILRLEDGSERAVRGSIALTESSLRHGRADARGRIRRPVGRQAGCLDGRRACQPGRSLGHARGGDVDWADAVRFSIYRDSPPRRQVRRNIRARSCSGSMKCLAPRRTRPCSRRNWHERFCPPPDA